MRKQTRWGRSNGISPVFDEDDIFRSGTALPLIPIGSALRRSAKCHATVCT